MNSQKPEILNSVLHHGALVDNSAVKVNDWHITPLITRTESPNTMALVTH